MIAVRLGALWKARGPVRGYPLPTPALTSEALTLFSQRTDLVGMSSLLPPAHWFLVLQGMANRHRVWADQAQGFGCCARRVTVFDMLEADVGMELGGRKVYRGAAHVKEGERGDWVGQASMET